jgi:hypothetical protein
MYEKASMPDCLRLTDGPLAGLQHGKPMPDKSAFSELTGHAFRDSDGQRWWVRGPRPGQEGQLVIEAEMKGSYPRVAVYTMTLREFSEHARIAALRPEKAPARRHSEKR